ncbi:MAG: sodium:calcium antiporter [Trueperaceae bacterium]|nr:sodium:calcium antiporter [Trueperaceae bacterium]
MAILLFVVGLGLVVYFSERLVEGVVGTSVSFGISAFLISVIFLGFDPENLAVGATGSYEQVAGIALGSVVGAAMVAVALAFGITALLAPMRFERVSKRILSTPVLAVLLFGLLSLDGRLSRLDGGILLLGFVAAICYLLWLSRRGLDIKATGEVAEALEQEEPPGRWASVGLFAFSLVAIVVGSELLITGSETIIERMGISDTAFGMTILAFLVSIEELARELPAALKGRSEISFGNVVGSILAFFLFNAGIIALVQPVPVSAQVLSFYLPVCLLTVIVLTAFMLRGRVSRWAGAVLVLLYGIFAAGGYF